MQVHSIRSREIVADKGRIKEDGEREEGDKKKGRS
jgi:hypothetical protein